MIDCKILLVDGNDTDRELLKELLLPEVKELTAINGPKRLNEYLRKCEPDIVILEMDFGDGIRNGNEGLFLMNQILQYDKSLPVIFITGEGKVEAAVKAIREGAFDLIIKPPDRAKILAAVSAAWKLRQSRIETSRLKNSNRFLKMELERGEEKIIMGASPTMINVMNIVRKVAPTDANVLITGENGTGKELVAREIHNTSSRRSEVLVPVDLGSVSESLFESELFGHVRGAFTDAREDRTGKIEAANNGTLFLDEIGNLSPAAQSKLLTVLQNRHIVKVGSNNPISVSIRLICATNRNLNEMVMNGSFREDLFYRINTIVIEVPPLRDRVDDIPILAAYFLKVYSAKYDRQGLKLSMPALEKLAEHDWPGNVRELQHAIEKAVIMNDGSIIRPSDFSFSVRPRHNIPVETTLEEMEIRMISASLKRHDNNLTAAANGLGITRQTLYNKIRKYRI